MAREPDGVLIRSGTTCGEETHLQVAGRYLRKFLRQAGSLFLGETRPDVAHRVGLILDRLHKLGVLVSKVAVHQLRLKIEETIAIVIPEPGSLGAFDGAGVETPLLRPRVDDELAVCRDELFF